MLFKGLSLPNVRESDRVGDRNNSRQKSDPYHWKLTLPGDASCIRCLSLPSDPVTANLSFFPFLGLFDQKAFILAHFLVSFSILKRRSLATFFIFSKEFCKLQGVFLFGALFLVLLGTLGAGSLRMKRDEVQVTGRIYVMASKPFTRVAILLDDGKVYALTGEYDKELRSLRGKRVTVWQTFQGKFLWHFTTPGVRH